MHIVVLEDDESLSAMMGIWLENAGHTSKVYGTGDSFKSGILQDSADLLVLDWKLPDTNGDEVIVWVRENLGWEIPVIFATGVESKEAVVRALEHGADDYMVKPVDRDEWLARINGQLRRKSMHNNTEIKLEIGKYVLDSNSHRITMDGEEVILTKKEFEVTELLLKNVGKLISRQNLMKTVWGYNSEINTRTVDTHVSRVRKKLQFAPEYGWRLTSIYNYGYRLEKLEKVAVV